MKYWLLCLIFFCHAAWSIAVSEKEIVPMLQTVYQTYLPENKGTVADYIPELKKVNPDYFGISIVTVEGKHYSIGDANVAFAIESISKPFVYGLVLSDYGRESVLEKIGMNATGEKFNSVLAIELHQDHLQNPLVNAGAIQTTSLVKGSNSNEKWQRVLSLFQRLSGEKVTMDESVYYSEMATNQHNRAIARLMDSYQKMYGDPDDATDRYTRACSVKVSANAMAVMGATLANYGVNPITHEKIFSPDVVRDILSAMTINGLYNNSGMWWFKVGLPAKSGVGGGMLAVVPGQMAIAVFSPRLDETGNSFRGQKVIEVLSQKWNLHLLFNKHSEFIHEVYPWMCPHPIL